MQHLDLTDEEAAALIKELADITGNDRYPFSPRIQTLRVILAKLKSGLGREPPATAEGLYGAARNCRQKATARLGELPASLGCGTLTTNERIKTMTIDVMITGSREYYTIYAHADQCPICHHKVTPRAILARKRSPVGGAELEIVYECPNLECDELLIGYFSRRSGPIRLYQARPFSPVPVTFSQPIQDISPTFCEIYDQAHQAEEFGLAQVCGVGYRKALEFLIKDYLIRNRPDDKAGIEAKMLGAAIDEYVDDQRIKGIAMRATWLGNDETHYQRRWIDKDLTDLKRLIDLVLHWIEAEHLTKEALASMPMKK
jgi:hypothetical protein